MKLALKFVLLLMVINMCFSCQEPGPEKLSPQEVVYQEARKKVLEYRPEMNLIAENADVMIQNRLMQLLDFVEDNEKMRGYFRASGHDFKKVKELKGWVDFAMEEIRKSRAFEPDGQQVSIYNQLKAKAVRDQQVMANYLRAYNPRFNRVQEVRRKTINKMLLYEIEEFIDSTLITEEAFDREIKGLNLEWDEIVEGARNFR